MRFAEVGSPGRRAFCYGDRTFTSCTVINMASVDPIPFAGEQTLSLRQIDELNGLAKGSSFRLFKTCEEELVEGRDFHWLNAELHAGFIDQLKREGRIYATTRNLVLLTRSGYEQIRVRSRS